MRLTDERRRYNDRSTEKKRLRCRKRSKRPASGMDLILLSLKMVLDLWIPKTIKLSWYGGQSTKRHHRKRHLHRNRPAEICPLSYLAVQREVADLWETKGNIQSKE